MQMNLKGEFVSSSLFLPPRTMSRAPLRARVKERRVASLAAVLAYTNDSVVDRFCSDYGIDVSEALRIFKDMLRWLWLNATHTVELECGVVGVPEWLGIRAEQMVIDEMWHIFLLYTDAYRSFCLSYFGFMIGHAPNENSHQALSPEDLESYLTRYLTYVEKNLGQDTVVRWFEDYGEIYSEEKLLGRRVAVIQKRIKALAVNT